MKAAEKQISLAIEKPGRLSAVFADIALTERVLQNLLDNAFKFTPGGGSITVLLTQTPKSVKIQVADTGIGMPAEEQSFIFERYKQLEKDPFPKKGLGIGLAIVKKILELHQVKIGVTSEPGKGACFWFELPSVQ